MSDPSSVVSAQSSRAASGTVSRALNDLVAQAIGSVSAADDPELDALVARVKTDFGAALVGIILYGSYSRGERDSLTDLYILIDDYAHSGLAFWHGLLNRVLPPNVYQLELDTGLRCKYALLPLAQFQRCVQQDFHSYFWARFAQPVRLLYARDQRSRKAIVDAASDAVRQFHREVARVTSGAVAAQAFWQRGLGLTYGCELRAESGKRAVDLAAANVDHFLQLTAAVAAENDWPVSGEDITVRFPSIELASGERRWRLRRWWGKALSVLRLLKASATFNNGFEYLLWKIERHSGIYVEPSPLAQKLPLLFGWPTFFKLYRLGAFR